MEEETMTIHELIPAMKKGWVRAGLGTALPYYSTEHLAQMEQIGDTETDWDFHIDNLGIDASYLIKKGAKNDKINKKI